MSLVAPNHYNIFDINRFKGPWDPTFLYLYSSIGGLLLCVAIVACRNRTTALFRSSSTVRFGLDVGGQNHGVASALSAFCLRRCVSEFIQYTYCIFSLAIAGLTAIGLDFLRVPNSVRWAVGLVIALDLFLVGSGRPMNSQSLKADPGVTPDAFDSSAALLSEVRRHVNQSIPPARFDTVDASMEWTYGAPILQLPSAAGISPMAPENAIQLRLFLHDGYRWGWNYPLEKLDSPVVDLLNVRYIITRGEDIPRLAAIPKFRHLASLPGNELFENLTAFPRFFLAHEARAVKSIEEARNLVQRHEIDLRYTAITDAPFELPPNVAGEVDEVKALKYEPNSIEVSTQASRRSFLVLSETYYPGWQAWLDDQPVPIVPTDIALRGVVVPAGAHRVRMEFRPPDRFYLARDFVGNCDSIGD